MSCPELLENISTNYKYWSEQLRLEEQDEAEEDGGQEAGQQGGDTSAPGGSCWQHLLLLSKLFSARLCQSDVDSQFQQMCHPGNLLKRLPFLSNIYVTNNRFEEWGRNYCYNASRQFYHKYDSEGCLVRIETCWDHERWGASISVYLNQTLSPHICDWNNSFSQYRWKIEIKGTKENMFFFKTGSRTNQFLTKGCAKSLLYIFTAIIYFIYTLEHIRVRDTPGY